MPLIRELAKIAARTSREKRSNPALIARIGRWGPTLAKLAPKSLGGRAAVGLGVAGGLHLGQDAFRSFNTSKPDLQKYYDQNQVASKALGQQAARLKAPTGFNNSTQSVRGDTTTIKSTPVTAGELLGDKAPQSGIEAPTNGFLRFLARPVHETRMSLGGDPGVYKPNAVSSKITTPGSNQQIKNPDGTVTQLGGTTTETLTQPHTNRSRLAKWLADMDAAQTSAVTGRHQQEGEQIIPKAQQDLRDNILATQEAHLAGSRQYQPSRAPAAALTQQLGLNADVLPRELPVPDTSGDEKNLGTLTRMNTGQPVGPPTRGVDDYSLEELGKIVARRQAEAAAAATKRKAVQNWRQQTLRTIGGQEAQPSPAVGTQSEAERRHRRAQELSRTLNAY